MTREEVIKAALEGYPGDVLTPEDFHKMTEDELYEWAQELSPDGRRCSGDTLLSFMIIELYEVLEEDTADIDRAIDALNRAADDMIAARNNVITLNRAMKTQLWAHGGIE